MPFQVNPETQTPLGANGTYTTVAHDVGGPSEIASASLFRAAAYSDQAGTIAIQHSIDGVTWMPSLSDAITANNCTIAESLICFRFVRAVYTNGATAQTIFALSTALVEA